MRPQHIVVGVALLVLWWFAMSWGWVGDTVMTISALLVTFWLIGTPLLSKMPILLIVVAVALGYGLTFTKPWKDQHPDIALAVGFVLLVGLSILGGVGIGMHLQQKRHQS